MIKRILVLRRILPLLLAACLALALFGCAPKEAKIGLNPGVYTGTGMGHGGPIEVQLTVNAMGRIVQVEILNESETPDYAARALEILSKDIVQKQSLGLDAIAGATLSYNGLLAAAADAITKAGGDPKDFGFVSVAERADDTQIVITGLPEGDFILTGAMLKSNYEITELDTVSINSKGTQKDVHAKGVLLETVLQECGVSQLEFDSVTANSTDGYAITIPSDVLRTRDILIAFETNGEAIAPRLVIPEERAMYWAKLLGSIELSGQAQEEPVTAELSLDGLIERLRDQAEDYKYYDETCRALPMALLLEAIGAEQTTFVTIRSVDGLCKVEKYETFAAQMLLFEGTPDAPLYIGPNLPTGMRMKNVESIQVGGILVKAD